MSLFMNCYNWLTILINLGLWVIGVLQWVGIERVERNSLATVNLIPELTAELVLIK